MKTAKQMLVALMLAVFVVAGFAGTALAAKTLKLHHLNKDDPFDNPTAAMATGNATEVVAATRLAQSAGEALLRRLLREITRIEIRESPLAVGRGLDATNGH